MTIKTIYRNKMNRNKYLEVVHYPCGHYHVVQFIRFSPRTSYNGKEIINYNGGTFKFPRHRCRWRLSNLKVLLEDYEIVT